MTFRCSACALFDGPMPASCSRHLRSVICDPETAFPNQSPRMRSMRSRSSASGSAKSWSAARSTRPESEASRAIARRRTGRTRAVRSRLPAPRGLRRTRPGSAAKAAPSQKRSAVWQRTDSRIRWRKVCRVVACERDAPGKLRVKQDCRARVEAPQAGRPSSRSHASVRQRDRARRKSTGRPRSWRR